MDRIIAPKLLIIAVGWALCGSAAEAVEWHYAGDAGSVGRRNIFFVDESSVSKTDVGFQATTLLISENRGLSFRAMKALTQYNCASFQQRSMTQTYSRWDGGTDFEDMPDDWFEVPPDSAFGNVLELVCTGNISKAPIVTDPDETAQRYFSK